MPSAVAFSIRDWSDEYSSVAFPMADQAGTETVANLDTNQLATLRDAVNGVSLGEIAREKVIILQGGNDARPASALAQREFGLRVFMETPSGEKRNLTIGAVDIASLTVDGGSDLVELADAGPMAALVSAIETYVEYAGEGVTVTHAQIVGRNS